MDDRAAQGSFQESVDPALLARLLVPLTAPGVVSLATARRIFAMVDHFARRLSLLRDLAQRRGRGNLRVSEVPLVHCRWVKADSTPASAGVGAAPARAATESAPGVGVVRGRRPVVEISAAPQGQGRAAGQGMALVAPVQTGTLHERGGQGTGATFAVAGRPAAVPAREPAAGAIHTTVAARGAVPGVVGSIGSLPGNTVMPADRGEVAPSADPIPSLARDAVSVLPVEPHPRGGVERAGVVDVVGSPGSRVDRSSPLPETSILPAGPAARVPVEDPAPLPDRNRTLPYASSSPVDRASPAVRPAVLTDLTRARPLVSAAFPPSARGAARPLVTGAPAPSGVTPANPSPPAPIVRPAPPFSSPSFTDAAPPPRPRVAPHPPREAAPRAELPHVRAAASGPASVASAPETLAASSAARMVRAVPASVYAPETEVATRSPQAAQGPAARAAEVDIDKLVESVERQLLRRISAERDRRGGFG